MRHADMTLVLKTLENVTKLHRFELQPVIVHLLSAKSSILLGNSHGK